MVVYFPPSTSTFYSLFCFCFHIIYRSYVHHTTFQTKRLEWWEWLKWFSNLDWDLVLVVWDWDMEKLDSYSHVIWIVMCMWRAFIFDRRRNNKAKNHLLHSNDWKKKTHLSKTQFEFAFSSTIQFIFAESLNQINGSTTR